MHALQLAFPGSRKNKVLRRSRLMWNVSKLHLDSDQGTGHSSSVGVTCSQVFTKDNLGLQFFSLIFGFPLWPILSWSPFAFAARPPLSRHFKWLLSVVVFEIGGQTVEERWWVSDSDRRQMLLLFISLFSKCLKVVLHARCSYRLMHASLFGLWNCI